MGAISYLRNKIKKLESSTAEKASIEDVNSQLAEITNQVDGNTSSLAAIRAAGIASPAGTYADLTALIAADPDHGKIYITLDDGNWCYWNGTAFVAGGVYQATALETDKTLTVSGAAADAKVTGDKVGELKSAINTLEIDTYFTLSDWRSGYIRESSTPIGSIGTSTQHIVSGYDGSYATKKGDGKTYKIEIGTGFKLANVGEYNNHMLGSFVRFVPIINNTITLSQNKFYIFDITKDPIGSISPSDVTSTTIVLTNVVYTDKSLSLSGKAADAKAVGDLLEEYHSFNWCDPETIAAHDGKYMAVDGSIGSSSNYSYTGMIPVEPGDVVYVLSNSMIKTGAMFRYVTAFDENKTVVAASGESTAGRTYTVPVGIKYVVVSIFKSGYDAKDFSINVGKMMPFDEYVDERLPKGYKQANDSLIDITKMPLSAMPAYIRNAMAYRPLQSPSKGYMCLVSDDGMEGLATYTCPMVIEKEVPCTFAVMSESEVFADDTLKATVLDAVENHGCAIAQHGGRNWTEYSEYGLNQFFDEEKAFFDSLGVSVKSAVIPSHYTTPLVQIVAGGRFGVVRSGMKGYDADGNYGHTVHNYYDFYTSGEGSNLYGLSSYNLSGYSLATNKLAIDYAYANNKILIVYWHENALDAEKKAVIEGAIDYAKAKGMEFITLDKIPYLTEVLSQF